ncbi:hypothetical protein C2E23DRAFT_731504 [Lenzites betulinus]|nr:hypothetical protein C2E23DRAFT_731504 [Lenzites betulinus]
MASADDATAQLILLYQAANSNLLWTSCAIALLAYDYLLTFHHEVRFVWGRKFSAATVLFVLNRYFIILLYVVDMVTQCPGVGRFITVLEVVPYIIWATFSSLRAYALSRRNAIIGVIIFVLSLVPAGVNAYFFSTFTFVNLPPPNNCAALSDITPELSKIHFSVTIVSRTGLMAADVLVVIVTWISTYRLGRASHDLHIGASFGVQLLRDGTIYFVVLIAMNIVHMVLNTVQPNNFVQQASYVTILENALTSILISRFILNLRAVDDRGGRTTGDTLYDNTSGPSFAPVLHFATATFTDSHVLGAPLDYSVFEDGEGDGKEDEVHGMEEFAGNSDAHCDVDDSAGEKAQGGGVEEKRGLPTTVDTMDIDCDAGSPSTSATLSSPSAVPREGPDVGWLFPTRRPSLVDVETV